MVNFREVMQLRFLAECKNRKLIIKGWKGREEGEETRRERRDLFLTTRNQLTEV